MGSRDINQTGLIVVSSASPHQTLEDLKGTAFAYVDRNSGSGFHYPNRLFKSRGIDPLTFFSRVVFTNSHDQSLHGVKHGHYAAAAVYEKLLKQAMLTMHQNETGQKILALLREIRGVSRFATESEVKELLSKTP